MIHAGLYGKAHKNLVSAMKNREDFKTSGALYGTTKRVWNTGRMPSDWAKKYTEAVENDEIVFTVVSYCTPIAWVLKNGEVVVPTVSYSQTTQKHKGTLYLLSM